MGDIPTFKIYDASENTYVDAYPSEEILPWVNLGYDLINSLSDIMSSTPGCMDGNACNYDAEATEDDGSCEYAEENYDCDGNCTAEVDCDGECGGEAVEDGAGECCLSGSVDECGVCDGDNTSCFEFIENGTYAYSRLSTNGQIILYENINLEAYDCLLDAWITFEDSIYTINEYIGLGCEGIPDGAETSGAPYGEILSRPFQYYYNNITTDRLIF